MPRLTRWSEFTVTEALLMAYAIVMGPLWMVACYFEDWGIQPEPVRLLIVWLIGGSIFVVPMLFIAWVWESPRHHQSHWALARIAAYVGLVWLTWQIPYETPGDRLWLEHGQAMREVAAHPRNDGPSSDSPFRWVNDRDGVIRFDWEPSYRINVLYLPTDDPQRHERFGSSFEYVMIRRLDPHWYVFEHRRT